MALFSSISNGTDIHSMIIKYLEDMEAAEFLLSEKTKNKVALLRSYFFTHNTNDLASLLVALLEEIINMKIFAEGTNCPLLIEETIGENNHEEYKNTVAFYQIVRPEFQIHFDELKVQIPSLLMAKNVIDKFEHFYEILCENMSDEECEECKMNSPEVNECLKQCIISSQVFVKLEVDKMKSVKKTLEFYSAKVSGNM